MFKWLVAILVFPLILLAYLVELASWVLHDLLEGLFDGVSLATEWIDKLPYPK